MNNQEFYSTVGYKTLIILCCIFSALLTFASFFLFSLSKTPLWVTAIAAIVTLMLVIRSINTFRHPEICFNGKCITIRGWFGGITNIDPYSEMTLTQTPDGLVIKQGTISTSFVPNTIGKKQVSELIKLINENGKISNKKMHLASTELGE